MRITFYLLMLAGVFSLALSCTEDDLSNDLAFEQVEEEDGPDQEADADTDSPDETEDTQEGTGEDPAEEAPSEESADDESTDTTDEEPPGDSAGDDTEEQGGGDGTNEEEETSGTDSCGPSQYVFVENEGIIMGEFEEVAYSGPWSQSNSTSDANGQGYLVWTGGQFFNSPGEGLIRYTIRIQNPGTYQFLWRSAVTIGNNGTEHNDTWLRFADADDFFAEKNGNKVYPRDVGKTPNPEGSSADGWFKVYRSGNDMGFKWQAYTYDNDGHNIFVTFASAGTYTMEVSARSSGHAIDRFVLFNTSVPESQALSAGLSAIECRN